MTTLITIFKSSRILAVAITGAVAVTVVYQFVVYKQVESSVLDVMLAIFTYWIGVFTPTPNILNGSK